MFGITHNDDQPSDHMVTDQTAQDLGSTPTIAPPSSPIDPAAAFAPIPEPPTVTAPDPVVVTPEISHHETNATTNSEPAPAPVIHDDPIHVVSTPSTSITSNDTNDLLSIKQKALQDLGPLVEHLEGSPEERFETLMMMIRATDDAKLIEPAHQAALGITDEQKRAHALLDVVNEINYLTQHAQTE